jgi:site-specific DNA recombinase
MTKLAAIYVRVNTRKQANQRGSLLSQIEACQKFATQKCLVIVGIYEDVISGMKSITHRPGGARLQSAITRGQITAVIVCSVDRLSRNIMDYSTTTQEWLQAGIDIYMLDIGQIMRALDVRIRLVGP